jgi:hypothetical protein
MALMADLACCGEMYLAIGPIQCLSSRTVRRVAAMDFCQVRPYISFLSLTVDPSRWPLLVSTVDTSDEAAAIV